VSGAWYDVRFGFGWARADYKAADPQGWDDTVVGLLDGHGACPIEMSMAPWKSQLVYENRAVGSVLFCAIEGEDRFEGDAAHPADGGYDEANHDHPAVRASSRMEGNRKK
jgi:hypothetical protein